MKIAKLGYILFISPRTCVFLVEYPRAVGRHFNSIAQKVSKDLESPSNIYLFAELEVGTVCPRFRRPCLILVFQHIGDLIHSKEGSSLRVLSKFELQVGHLNFCRTLTTDKKHVFIFSYLFPKLSTEQTKNLTHLRK